MTNWVRQSFCELVFAWGASKCHGRNCVDDDSGELLPKFIECHGRIFGSIVQPASSDDFIGVAKPESELSCLFEVLGIGLVVAILLIAMCANSKLLCLFD